MEESEIVQIMKDPIIRGCWGGFSNAQCFVQFYPSCPPTLFYRQKQLKSLFWNLVHLLRHSSFQSSLSSNLSSAHSVFSGLELASAELQKEKSNFQEKGSPITKCEGLCMRTQGPRGRLCLLVLEGVCSTNLTGSTNVHTPEGQAQRDRERERWPGLKEGA